MNKMATSNVLAFVPEVSNLSLQENYDTITSSMTSFEKSF